MADETNNGNSTGAAGAASGQGANPAAGNGTQTPPQLKVLVQYTKDLSFENPGAPQALRALRQNPEINLNINVSVTPLGEDQYDVQLKLDSKATSENKPVFQVELVYGGVFLVKDFAKEHLTPVLHIECPRLLFPFARQIVADATRNGGFPPLMLEPIDFAAIFARQVAELRARQQVADPQQA